ncbi:MAG: hypothetical protein ACREHD_11950, partial [Pirellulales bacterium]
VFGPLHVKFEAQSKFKAGPEICQRVFWGVNQQATVADDQAQRRDWLGSVRARLNDEVAGYRQKKRADVDHEAFTSLL